MSFLVELPEEIASELSGAVGKAFDFMGAEMTKLGAAMEALSARMDDAHKDTAPPATP